MGEGGRVEDNSDEVMAGWVEGGLGRVEENSDEGMTAKGRCGGGEWKRILIAEGWRKGEIMVMREKERERVGNA